MIIGEHSLQAFLYTTTPTIIIIQDLTVNINGSEASLSKLSRHFWQIIGIHDNSDIDTIILHESTTHQMLYSNEHGAA